MRLVLLETTVEQGFAPSTLTLPRGGCRWQRGDVPRWTSGLAIHSAIPLFLDVQNRQAHPRGGFPLIVFDSALYNSR